MSLSKSRHLMALLPLIVATFFLGNSGGPASNGNFYTGAPKFGGGTERTCSVCHSTGDFGQPEINVSFALDGVPTDLTTYTPGATYRVTVAVGYGAAAPAAYGFSSQFLTTTAPAPEVAGAAANPDAATQVITGDGGRVYIEQNAANQDSTFSFDWTAPEAGAGPVEYYVVGNLVNGASGTLGDNGSTEPTVITLAEGSPSGLRDIAVIPHKLYPNPTAGVANLTFDAPGTGAYQLSILGLDGKVLRDQQLSLSAGANSLPLPVATLKPGVYIVQLSGTDGRLTSRLAVR
ncbi:T9SS type A sorting domain-containing protein [Neolewinella aurantiaca]|uniref:T9SS type A sorting domain-containing protein n=1 Tax=Neolewinella aurantiaca TaxID=2602767 RepID=A0A5C7FL70_9BACT|nr:T9SS type A sorting domain-containing protein [Neolewinella aurantiaca]TXF88108.1 T9SS type A sorting domain-containing protein [Neolewinella aurantiaca]